MLVGVPKRRSRGHSEGAVYFIQGVKSGHIKIGFSTDVPARAASLTTGSAETLRLLGTIPGTQSDEQALHRTFQHLRVKGEWFESGPDLIAYIVSAISSPKQ